MDLKKRTVLVAMTDPAWLVGARLKHAGARLVMADSLAAAQQVLHADETGFDALVVGVRLPDGYAGSLIREARSGPHPCAALVCVTDPPTEAFLVRPALMEGPWDLLELPKDTSRVVRAVESTVRRTQALRRWMGVGSNACGPPAREPDAPVVREHIDSRIMKAALALAGPEKLSLEELEVLRELAAGHRPPEIASRTGKAVETVRTQVKALRQKLGARSVVHLLSLINEHAFASLSNELVLHE